MENIKMVVIGDGAVGKSCLLISYSTGTFPNDYVPTVFDNYNVQVIVNGKPISLQIFDTAGQEDYDCLRPLSYASSDVFLICFSLVNRTSMSNIINKWLPEVNRYTPEAAKVLVGTKMDLRESRNTINMLNKTNEIPVTKKEGEEMAKRHGFDCYFETSALTLDGVKSCFDAAINSALYPKKKSKKFGLFSFFGGKRGKFDGKNTQDHFNKLYPPLPPVMPETGKAPFLNVRASTYSDDFKKMMNNELCSDVKFRLNEKEIFSHKVILMVSCTFFEKLFTKKKSEQNKIVNKYDEEAGIIFLNNNINENAFMFLLEFFYTGYVEEIKDIKLKKEVENLGKLFEIDQITTFCENMKSFNLEDGDFFKGMNLSLQSYILDERSKVFDKLYNNDRFSDVTFRIGEKNVKLHKIVLASRNEYLKTLLFTRFKEGQSDIITIEEDENYLEEFQYFLKFIYTSHTHDFIKDNTALKILQLCNKFRCERLVNFCEIYASKLVERECSKSIELSSIDVIGILLFSDFFKAEQLKKFCLHFISTNYICFKKRKEWDDLKKKKELFKHVEKNKWPPDSYLKAVEKYKKKLEEFNNKSKKKIEIDIDIDIEGKIKSEKKKKKKKSLFYIPFISRKAKNQVDEDVEIFSK